MAKFVYEARGMNGQEMRGEIDAGNEAEARVKLRAQRIAPIRVVPSTSARPAKKFSIGSGVNSKDLQIFTRQLATLLGSGIPILQSIDTLGQTNRSAQLTAALKTIGADISRGKRLAEAMAEHPKVFNRFFINMVRAGEESGSLDQILGRLASYIEKSVKLQNQVKGAMMYPVVVSLVAGSVVIGLLTFVIPKFQTFFTQMNGELPPLTRAVIWLSNAFVTHWYLIVGGIGFAIYTLLTLLRSEQGKEKFDLFLISMPVFGDLAQKSAIARFTRTLSTLLGSGVGIMEALEISARTAGNSVIEKGILRARDSITEGKSLTAPLAKEKHFPQMVTQMIGVGEQTGNLDQMLSKVADFYEDEVEVAVGSITTIIEPVMIVGLGIIIGVLVIAMYLPIFNMAGTVNSN